MMRKNILKQISMTFLWRIAIVTLLERKGILNYTEFENEKHRQRANLDQFKAEKKNKEKKSE